MAYFDNLDPCWVPDAPLGVDRQWRLREAQFGDGYKQRILDGINALERKWRVQFYREESIVLAINNYLESVQGAGFPFVDPTTFVSYVVFCDQWQISWDVKRPGTRIPLNYQWYGTLSAEFTRANGVNIGPII